MSSSTHVSVLEMKADRKARSEARKFAALISITAVGLIVSGSLIAISAFFTDGLGVYTYVGIAMVATVVAVVGPVVAGVLRTGKIATN